MITVYNASNSIEAHLIKNLLEQQAIIAYVFGDFLQGGVGEIPAMGLVTVNVSDSDYTKAKAIVDAWDSSSVIENIDANYVLSPSYPRG
ncbi:MAG: putative signal transducing protein [Methylophilaceae bacterium]